MIEKYWVLAEEGNSWLVGTTAVVVAFAIVQLIAEFRTGGERKWACLLTGLTATAAIALAVLRPTEVEALEERIGGRIDVLVDQSQRLKIPTTDGTRWQRATEVVTALQKQFPDARMQTFSFAGSTLSAWSASGEPNPGGEGGSDLLGALQQLKLRAGERAQAVVVVSDGRVTSPLLGASDATLKEQLSTLGAPIHTVAVEDLAPDDISIRAIRTAATAVAHQRMALTVDVGCSGDIECPDVPVTVSELRPNGVSTPLAAGIARFKAGEASVELEITLDLAGSRIVEVAIAAPPTDTIAENNSRLLTYSVARERIRLLHLAGRPTYDVRALRSWLQSDEAVDVVAFFILRDSEGDDHRAPPREMALIEFPVDELFTEHLNSFDAVILQDIDAVKYKLDRYLSRLTAYVKDGHGLIMVGGPSSFAGGNYAGTDLDEILPIEPSERAESFDGAAFVPRYTEAGQSAAITHTLRQVLGTKLPAMTGTNWLGRSRPGTIVLWEHPRLLAGEEPMPVLALGEAGEGRSIALSVDATHRLAFGQQAAEVSGRAYGALWDGLLGWLMRNPRYEAVRLALVGQCVAGRPAQLRLTQLPGMSGEAEIQIAPLGLRRGAKINLRGEVNRAGVAEFPVENLEAGGYSATAQVGSSPPTRNNFACDRADTQWADTRPAPDHLARIAASTGGVAVRFDEVDNLPEVSATSVAAERKSSPVAPPWLWTLASGCLLGLHWVARRSTGAL